MEDATLPSAYGSYPDKTGPNGSAFFFILPQMDELDATAIYSKYSMALTSVPTTGVVKTFYAPLDSSNDGISSLTSYGTNAGLLGTTPGGTVLFSDVYKGKGTSYTVVVMERFAQTTTNGFTTQHYWQAVGKDKCSVYEDALATPEGRVPAPVFGATPQTVAVDNTAHAFSRAGVQVGMLDGSVRLFDQKVTTAGGVSGHPTTSVWDWACAGPENPLFPAPVPKDW